MLQMGSQISPGFYYEGGFLFFHFFWVHLHLFMFRLLHGLWLIRMMRMNFQDMYQERKLVLVAIKL